MDKYKLGAVIKEHNYLYPGYQITIAIVENTPKETPYLYIVGDRIMDDCIDKYKAHVHIILKALNQN